MRLPWISREHHQEVLAAKDALILSLEAQNAVLAERLAEPVAVTVKLPENFAMVQPAVVRHKKEKQQGPDSRKDAPEVDWANVDSTNPYVMAQLAAQEYGRMLSPIELTDWTRRVQRQIRVAKEQALQNPQIPTVGVLETRADSGVREVPEHIKEAIAAAERV